MATAKTIETLARNVIRELRKFTNPERQAATLSYFPSAMENLGVAVPDLRKVLRWVKGEARELEDAELLALVQAIIDQATLEGRQLAYELLATRKSLLYGLTTAQVKRLGKGMDNWVSVDTFAVSITGQLWREHKLGDAEILRWSRSRDRWWRRAALVSTIPLNMKSRGGTGDVERTMQLCEALADDEDEMVAKALSWALRALIPVSPVHVEDFLADHDDILASRVKREVRRKLETGKKH